MAEAEGIPPTASVASVGPGIRYVGDYAYAYSGQFATNTSAVIHFAFTSGSGILVADLFCNGATKIGDPSAGRTTVWNLSFNDIVIVGLKTDSASADYAGPTIHNKIIIPPFTEVELEAYSDSVSADRLTSAVISGRVYDA